MWVVSFYRSRGPYAQWPFHSNRSGDRDRTSRGDKPTCIRYGGLVVGITIDWGSYSMSQARVTIPRPYNNSGMYGVLQRNETEGGVSHWLTGTNQWRRQWIHKAEASCWWQLPKNLQGTHRKNAKRCMSSLEAVANMCERRFDACIAMPWPLDQGTQMLIVARIVTASCHHLRMSHKHSLSGFGDQSILVCNV